MAAAISLASKRTTSAECSEILAGMSDEASRGEIVSVCVVFERADGTTGSWQSGTTNMAKMAGILLDAAVRRLGYVREAE